MTSKTDILDKVLALAPVWIGECFLRVVFDLQKSFTGTFQTWFVVDLEA